MVHARQFLYILSLIPISLAIILPVQLQHRHQSCTSARDIDGRDVKWTARPKQRDGLERRDLRPEIRVRGLDIEVHTRRQSDHHGKRAISNGTIVNLGESLNTYMIPLSIGTPPTTYPVQLDLGSSDILLVSTLCDTECPTSLGETINPYYGMTGGSSSFQAVNGNTSLWNSSFADGSVASGFLARENVGLGNVSVEGQVFGLINSTNLTLAQQEISGILGLGFPRLSILARALFSDRTIGTTSSIGSASSPLASSSASSVTASRPTSSSVYLPPFLESLVAEPHIPYPVFGLALAPPPRNTTSTPTSTSSAPSASTSSRYQTNTGSITFGGVSSLYVSSNTSSGRTIDDIEWWQVVPFGMSTSLLNDASPVTTARFNTTSSLSSTSPAPTSTLPPRKRQNTYPETLEQLATEEYLYWAITLSNLSFNGTDIPLHPTYARQGIPSIALLDVGSNGIYGPQQDVERIFEGIADARQVETGLWAVPCVTRATIGFSFGGRYVQLQPEDWIFAAIAGSTFCLAWPAVAPATGDGIDWQLGTPFLKKVYTVFSYGINAVQAPLIGFLPIPDETPVTATLSPPTASTLASINDTSTSRSSTSTSFNPAAPTQIDAFTATTTVNTALPNAVLADPSYPTPSYAYTTTRPLALGALQTMGLADNSAYSVGPVPVVGPSSAGVSSSTSSSGFSGSSQDGGSIGGQGGTSRADKRFSDSGWLVWLGLGMICALWIG